MALLVHVTFGGGRGVGSVSFESLFSQAREIGEPGGLNGIADSRGDRGVQGSMAVGNYICHGVIGHLYSEEGLGLVKAWWGGWDVPEVVGSCRLSTSEDSLGFIHWDGVGGDDYLRFGEDCCAVSITKFAYRDEVGVSHGREQMGFRGTGW